jgi:peptide chain release factor 1
LSSLVFTPRWGRGGVFDLVILDERPGILVFRASGKDVAQIFQYEAGGHRWQRNPPNEKRGRVHTSTVTVAVLPEASEAQVNLDMRDVEIRTCRGSGAGGQHRNKTETAIQATHKPTGIHVRCENERSQHQNREDALKILRAKLLERAQSDAFRERAQDRKNQVGSGQRGDKVITCAVQRDSVVHHGTGKSTTYQRYRKGFIEDLW